jgi:outer membrane protein TolC
MRNQLGSAAFVAALLSTVPAHAGAQAPARTISLVEAARHALAHNPEIASRHEQVNVTRGQAQYAGAAFETQLRSFVGGNREQSALGALPGADASLTNPTSHLTYGVSMDRRLRSGIVLGHEVRMARTATAGSTGSAPNVATAQLSATLPLLRGRGGSAWAVAAERASASASGANALELRQSAGATIVGVTRRYWHYVSLQRQLEVYRQAEARARTLVEETRTLVEKDERPASDMNQLLANLAFREATRIAAEQLVIEERLFLGLAMGLPADQIPLIPAPADDFPRVPDGVLSGEGVTAALVEVALRERADLRAVELHRAAAQARRAGAANEMKPRLDVGFRVGYSGAELGGGLSRLATPFYGDAEGFSSGLEVTYQRAVRNEAAKGLELQSRAQLRQIEIQAEQRQREIRANVETVVSVLRLAQAEVERSRRALELYRAVVETEKAKFQMGMSTLFDVIQAEEGLTRALVNDIGALERQAIGLLYLRHETGTLLGHDGERLSVTPESLVTIPDIPGSAAARRPSN